VKSGMGDKFLELIEGIWDLRWEGLWRISLTLWTFVQRFTSDRTRRPFSGRRRAILLGRAIRPLTAAQTKSHAVRSGSPDRKLYAPR
jgi:hypothetical protein